jgi:hypothetical protein
MSCVFVTTKERPGIRAAVLFRARNLENQVLPADLPARGKSVSPNFLKTVARKAATRILLTSSP